MAINPIMPQTKYLFELDNTNFFLEQFESWFEWPQS